MASKTYTQYFADGSHKTMRRRVTQGRTPNPPELVKVQLTINVLPRKKYELVSGAKAAGMSLSSYCETALILYDYAIFQRGELLIS